MGQSDAVSVRLCLDGHPEEFGRLVERYQAPLIGYLSGRLGNRERAEEVAQEAFVRSFQALSALRKQEAFFPWLVGIAERAAREETRRSTRRRDMPPDMSAAASTAPDYELEAAVAALEPEYRELVLLRFYGGLSCAEVATRLGAPVGTVTKRLSRAYALLRERLDKRGEGQEDRR